MEQNLRTIMKHMELALEQVIADAQTAEGTSYSAFDGKLLTQSGDHYIYQFKIRTQWEPEENSRIYVKIDEPTGQKLSARVVSLVGTTLMLTTGEPIAPPLLKKVTLLEDTVWLLERQREVLKGYLEGRLLEAPGGFAVKVLDLAPVRYNTKKPGNKLRRLKFLPDTQQQQAIEHGLGSERTLIIGPGGTGKSAVEALLGNYLLKENCSILAVSHTNIATDNMFLRLVQFAEESGETDLLHLLHSRRLVRQGDPRHRSLLTGAYRHLTVNAIADERQGNLSRERLHREEAQRTLGQHIEHLTQRVQQQEERWQGELTQLKSAIKHAQAALSELEERERKRVESIDRGIQEEEDKVAAAKQQLAPLAVQQEALEYQLREWQGDLHRQTRNGERARRQTRLEAAQQALVQLQRKRALQRFLAGRQHELDVAAAQREIATRKDALDEGDRVISHLKGNYQQNQVEQIGPQVTIQKAEAEIKRLQAAYDSTYWTDQMKPYRNKVDRLLTMMQKGEDALASSRAELESAKGEKSRNDARLVELKAQLAAVKSQIVTEARLIATTITGVYLNPDLLRRQFDVVLVDEISMISVIAALLVALRATKHFIGGGDPMQILPILKTVCSEQKRMERMPEAVRWLARDLLSYLGVTIFEAINGEKGCILLVQQGRMHPKILAPINHYVYQHMLVSRPETEHAPPIAPLPDAPLMLVDSSASPESRTRKPGKNESRMNEHHVKVVVALVLQILASLPEQSEAEDSSVPRIGVLAPYRSQARRLLRALREARLDEHVHVGTINTAQALEFDAVILDTVEAPGLAPFRFTFDRILDERNMATDATRRLNVGHTCARFKLIYLAHLKHLHRYQPENPNDEPHRRRLLVELTSWAAREGVISSLDVLRSEPGESGV
ncbi:MAG: DEAD/DEAH box helicase [Ktedonobacteraceae bacterium]